MEKDFLEILQLNFHKVYRLLSPSTGVMTRNLSDDLEEKDINLIIEILYKLSKFRQEYCK